CVCHSVQNEIAALGVGQKTLHAPNAETALNHAAESLHVCDHGGNLLRFRYTRADRCLERFDVVLDEILWPRQRTQFRFQVAIGRKDARFRSQVESQGIPVWQMMAREVVLRRYNRSRSSLNTQRNQRSI